MATKSQPFSWSRLLLNYQVLNKPTKPPLHFSRKISTFTHFPTSQTPKFSFLTKTHYSTVSERVVHDLLAEVEKERHREREQRKRAGLDTKDIDAEDEEDYMGVMPLIERLEKEKLKDTGELNRYEERSDSDSDDDDERFSNEAVKKRKDEFDRKFKRHEELLKNFTEADTLDDAFKWMYKIDKFEQKHFRLRLSIGSLKLNRAMRLVEWTEAYDPNNPANYGVIHHEQVGASADLLDQPGFEKAKQLIQGDDDDEEEFDDMKERDDILIAKINSIDKKLEEKLAELDHTFGKKGKLLEEEIRDLAEERNDLTEKKRRPLYRKGFDVKLIDVNRTCKVTKGGQVVKYTAILACGNYHGLVGFAKAKGPAIPIALQKAYEKCFQNLHYVERHEEHTIAHAVQTAYKKTKVYLWPAPTRTGMKAGKTVQTILNLAGFKNIKSKVETPKDVQEKFGRTVVEKIFLNPDLSLFI
ncbi:30s ribosomal protein s5 [Quercus suber]|uniref:30s ribosomal protein s5 n=1 Tax=Quercus suber TaxID=58331 RepID=A0AAW0M3B9_QUESU